LVERLLLVAEPPAVTGVCDAKSAYAVVAPLLVNKTVEHFVAVALNRKHRVMNVEILTSGSDSYTVVDARQVLSWALRQGATGAAAIIVAHNHPSGDPTPSTQDRGVTRLLKRACDVVGISLLDHLVIGGLDYTSLAETTPDLFAPAVSYSANVI
jgi:DNA repair protein RadC